MRTKRKRSSQRTSTPSLKLPVQFFSGYQHTLALGEMKWQISSQKKEGKRSNPHHMCPTEKSKLLSMIKIKPSSTARLEDTTQPGRTPSAATTPTDHHRSPCSPSMFCNYKDEKTVIKSFIARKWHQKHPDFNPTDGCHYLDRTDQVILIRLRTGHNRMNAHMYSKLKIGQMIAVLVTAPITSQHLLQDCPLHDVVRQETWPKDTSLRGKLFGDLQALRRTADFILMKRISI